MFPNGRKRLEIIGKTGTAEVSMSNIMKSLITRCISPIECCRILFPDTGRRWSCWIQNVSISWERKMNEGQRAWNKILLYKARMCRSRISCWFDEHKIASGEVFSLSPLPPLPPTQSEPQCSGSAQVQNTECECHLSLEDSCILQRLGFSRGTSANQLNAYMTFPKCHS